MGANDKTTIMNGHGTNNKGTTVGTNDKATCNMYGHNSIVTNDKH